MSGIVFIVDDDAAVRDAVSVLVHSVGLTSREYASAESFLQDYKNEHPACLITDVCLPGTDGIALQEHLIEEGIRLPLIVISGHGDISMAVKMVRKGALDFLEKPFRNHVLMQRIQEALSIDESHQQEISQQRQWYNRYEDLTPREQQIAQLLSKGDANKVIASKIHLSPRTVETHRANLLRKMGVRSVTSLAQKMTLYQRPDSV